MSRIAFRVDSSNLIGNGHVTRCLVLADALRQRGADVRFLCRTLPGALLNHIEARGFVLVTLSPKLDVASGSARTCTDVNARDMSWPEDMAATQHAIGSWGDVDFLVVDHYGLDARWERAMRGLVRHVMVIDDLANRPHDCDLLLDHNCGADQGPRYDPYVSSTCRRLLGPGYALLSPAFNLERGRRRDRDGVVRRVLVSFGGADSSDETTKAIVALVSICRPDLDVAVAVGGSNLCWEKIAALCSAHHNICCHHNPLNMAELFATADLAIGAGGMSLLERCLFSLPAIVESLAPNQVPGCRALAQRGGALYLGDAAHTTSEQIGLAVQVMLCSPDLLQHMSKQAGKVTDGRGVERVVREMLAAPLVLRPADAGDCDTIWRWRNDKLTRRFANDPSEIPLDAHRGWFAAVLRDTGRHLLVAEDDSGAVGVVRYDVIGDVAMISVFVDPQRHRQGLGSRLIAAGEKWLRARHSSIRKVIAEVNSANMASIRAFARAGYVIEAHRLVRELGGTNE
jgi:UDP-2,4-diacetamido-2,4,6-trideoxy-beta-L-altropyranose hydrolase